MIGLSKPAIFVAFLLAAPLGCQKEDSNTEATTPAPVPKPVPVPASEVIAKIASVQMHQDCPDPVPANKAAPATPETPALPAKPSKSAKQPPAESPAARSAPADSAYNAPCMQSTMQVSFSSSGELSGNVSLREVRMLAATSGDVLATLKTRSPSLWQENGYQPWDEALVPGGELKASYKLTPPDWGKVQAKTDGDSHGVMFILEVDVEIDGAVQTLRSSDFARQQMHMVPT